MKTVKDLMKTKVFKVFPKTDLRTITRYIFKERYHAVPVVDKNDRLLGVISEQDILQKIYPDYPEFIQNLDQVQTDVLKAGLKKIGKYTAENLLNRTVFTISIEASLFRALSKMSILQISQLPVVGEHRILLGMIYKNDIFSNLLEQIVFKKKK